nr:hypothetical protein [Sphingomonas sp. CDS-1]
MTIIMPPEGKRRLSSQSITVPNSESLETAFCDAATFVHIARISGNMMTFCPFFGQ